MTTDPTATDTPLAEGGRRDPALQALLDKQEITEVLTRYLRAVDRGDIAALRSCYLPGAVEDHGGVFAGPAEEYVAGIARLLTHPRSLSTHCMSNVLVELDGDRAAVESYITAFARVRTTEGPGDSLTVARLIDRFERRDGRWGIAHRRLVWEWNRDDRPAETWVFGMLLPQGAELSRGAKFPDDPVYSVLP